MEDHTGDYGAALEAAVRAAWEAGEILREEFLRPDGPRGSGGTAAADTEAEIVIRGILEREFPEFGIRGEELGSRDRPPEDRLSHVWVVDPNDGTRSYLRGHRGSAVSIALLRSGELVLGVVYAFAHPDGRGDLFAWAEGCGPLRRNGRPVERKWAESISSRHTVLVSQDADRYPELNAGLCAPARFRAMPSVAYRLALAAAGECEAAVSLNGPIDWDYAGGHALLLGAGGVLLDQDGQPVRYGIDGKSRCGWRCFAGSEPVARTLSRRGWHLIGRPGRQSTEGPVLRPRRGMAVREPHLLSRAQGCLLGQLCGDALGSQVEFRAPDDIQASYPQGLREMSDGGAWNTLAGQPTDDSELALALARSIVENRGYEASDVLTSYVEWFDSRPFDCGHTIRSALEAASNAMRTGLDPVEAAHQSANADSQANGALMRISPLGIFCQGMDYRRAAALAREDAALTHPHPICVEASALFTVLVSRAVAGGEKPEDLYAFACEWAGSNLEAPEILETLRAAASGAPDDFMKQGGWVRIALQNAVYQMLTAAGVEDGVVDTVSRGGDTDTNAAIAGALLGAVHGADFIPRSWKDRVLTCRPQAGREGVRHPRPHVYWPVDALVLAERLVIAGMG